MSLHQEILDENSCLEIRNSPPIKSVLRLLGFWESSRRFSYKMKDFKRIFQLTTHIATYCDWSSQWDNIWLFWKDFFGLWSLAKKDRKLPFHRFGVMIACEGFFPARSPSMYLLSQIFRTSQRTVCFQRKRVYGPLFFVELDIEIVLIKKDSADENELFDFLSCSAIMAALILIEFFSNQVLEEAKIGRRDGENNRMRWSLCFMIVKSDLRVPSRDKFLIKFESILWKIKLPSSGNKIS